MDNHDEDVRQDFLERILFCLRIFSSARREVQPSKYWQELNKKNIKQLTVYGYENFKRTVALNYCTWLVPFKDKQIKYLMQHVTRGTVASAFVRTILKGKHRFLTYGQSMAMNFLTILLWEYARRNDPERLLGRITEPLEGNPFRIYVDGQLASQDLANSLIEYQSIREACPDATSVRTIMEVGSGYGRNAYFFLKALPHVKYVLVDIPPAICVAEKYLSRQFPEKKIFPVRAFQTFAEIKNEFNNADIVFFLPNQIELLPEKSADFFINISSLHEMRPDQIQYYFHQVERLTRQYFYFKQWKKARIPVENIVLTESDWPVPSRWRQVYWRTCRVQTSFSKPCLHSRARLPSV